MMQPEVFAELAVPMFLLVIIAGIQASQRSQRMCWDTDRDDVVVIPARLVDPAAGGR
jgi:hypothetical protein